MPAMTRTTLLLLLLAPACAGPPPPAPPPDLVLTGGAIYTLDASRRWADALSIRDGRIVAVGTGVEVAATAGPATRTVDLGGRFVMPAFHDAHVHPVSAGVELGQCNLNDVTGAEATLKAIGECAVAQKGSPRNEGGGWSMPSFPGGLPTRQMLDAVTGSKPTALSSADAHSMWDNSAALAAAAITNDTPDPPAGHIERDATGEATGMFLESATALISRVVPPVTAAEYEAGLVRALAQMNRFGIVSFQEANAREEYVAASRAVARQGKLTARARLSLYTDPSKDVSQVARLVQIRAETTEPGVVAGAAKLFMDGVIESGTAALIEPYVPLASETRASANPRGLPNFTDERLQALVTRLDREGFQVHMHAIGDAGIRQGLNAVAAAARANGPRDRRHHMAHIQLFDPADIPRFRELGVVANMEPLWAYADDYITKLTEPRLGRARSRWLYPFESLLRSGAVLAGGSLQFKYRITLRWRRTSKSFNRQIVFKDRWLIKEHPIYFISFIHMHIILMV
jgi:predicted amidohydrolase YtcJ